MEPNSACTGTANCRKIQVLDWLEIGLDLRQSVLDLLYLRVFLVDMGLYFCLPIIVDLSALLLFAAAIFGVHQQWSLSNGFIVLTQPGYSQGRSGNLDVE